MARSRSSGKQETEEVGYLQKGIAVQCLVSWINSASNCADLFTKALNKSKTSVLVQGLSLLGSSKNLTSVSSMPQHCVKWRLELSYGLSYFVN